MGRPLGTTKTICKQGHNTSVSGKYENGDCIVCRRQYHQLRWNSFLPDQRSDSNAKRKQRNWNKWGIVNKDGTPYTLEDYERDYQGQDGKCKLCNVPATKLCADHDHESGLFRALLCNRCNRKVGSLTTEEALKVAAYLKLCNPMK